MVFSLLAQVLLCRKAIEISECHFHQYQFFLNGAMSRPNGLIWTLIIRLRERSNFFRWQTIQTLEFYYLHPLVLRGNFSWEKFLRLPADWRLGFKMRWLQIYVLQMNILFHSFCHPYCQNFLYSINSSSMPVQAMMNE